MDLFIYPGAAAIHLVMMGFALLFFYRDWSAEIEMLAGTVGIVVVGMFMIMMGIGKLSDLKYLRVVASIFAASALAALVYSVLITIIPGDFFGLFLKASLPLPLIVGYLVKKDTDRRIDLKSK